MLHWLTVALADSAMECISRRGDGEAARGAKVVGGDAGRSGRRRAEVAEVTSDHFAEVGVRRALPDLGCVVSTRRDGGRARFLSGCSCR